MGDMRIPVPRCIFDEQDKWEGKILVAEGHFCPQPAKLEMHFLPKSELDCIDASEKCYTLAASYQLKILAWYLSELDCID